MKLDLPTVTSHYSKMQIETASQNKQIALLHIRMIDLIRWAKDLDFVQRRENLRKAQNILAQLEAALKDDDVVAQGLFYIYDYAYTLLIRGNNDDCDKAVELLDVISETFRNILNIY